MFADTNVKIRTIRQVFRKAPHLASKLKYTVRNARPEDYYIPKTLAHACKVVDVQVTEDLCKALSCNPTTENGMCRADTGASYYYVGDSDYDVQCQPACFNTASKHTYNKDGSRAPDTVMLNYHNGKCRIVPSTIVAYLEKPFFRSNIVYETRVNDMPTGFSRTMSDNPNGCGFDYKTNETYCKYYDRELEEDGSCSLAWWEKGLDAVVGMSLINTAKSTLRALSNQNSTPFDLPADLPTLPATLDSKYTLDGWKSDINYAFVLPETVETLPTRIECVTERDVSLKFDGAIEPALKRNKETGFSKLKVNTVNFTSKGDKSVSAVDDETGSEELSWIERMKSAMLGMLELVLTDRSFWTHLGVGLVSDAMLVGLKGICKKIVETMSISLVKMMPKIMNSVQFNVLQAALKSTCLKIVVGKIVRIASKSAVTLAKMTSAAVSVVGWFLLAASLLDILFSIWDPYGYDNMFPAKLPHDLMSNGERAFRQAAESATLNYDFDSFAALMLSEEEMLGIQIESLQDRLAYLSALEVNSDGTRISESDTIHLNGTRVQAMIDEAHNRAMIERARFDPETYAEYNRDFLTRVLINKRANQGALTCVIAAGGLTIAGLYLLSALSILLALIALSIARLQIYDNTIVDFVRFHRSAMNVKK